MWTSTDRGTQNTVVAFASGRGVLARGHSGETLACETTASTKIRPQFDPRSACAVRNLLLVVAVASGTRHPGATGGSGHVGQRYRVGAHWFSTRLLCGDADRQPLWRYVRKARRAIGGVGAALDWHACMRTSQHIMGTYHRSRDPRSWRSSHTIGNGDHPGRVATQACRTRNRIDVFDSRIGGGLGIVLAGPLIDSLD